MYFTHNDLSKYYVLDVETDGLSPSVIWCIVITRVSDRRSWSLSVGENNQTFYHELKELLESFGKDAIFVGHNIITFDSVVISRFCDVGLPIDRLVDTLVLSYLYNPHIPNGHSLDAWGVRLGFPKGGHSDWSRFTPEMLTYCERDVELTLRLFLALTKKMASMGFSEKSAWIEHRIRRVIDKQTSNGVYFDVPKANLLLTELSGKRASLSDDIHKLFPRRLTLEKTYDYKTKLDGTPYSSYSKHAEKYPEIRFIDDNSRYECYDWEEFNIGSPKQRTERLLELGWEPVNMTEAGNPKVDEDALLAFAEASGKPEIKAIAQWLVLQGRITMLAGNPETGSLGWMGNVTEDSRIHGEVLTCGAASRRMRHFKPNTTNIPSEANGALYGREVRELWTVTPNLGRVLVGYDAKGLENVGLCHYLNSQKATDLLTKGDVHTENMNALTAALGFPVVRGGGGAKNCYYAWLYGAGKKKLGSIVKRGPDVGEIIDNTLRSTVPGMDKLLSIIEDEFESSHGLLRTIDGGFVRCSSPHSALNYKIQSLGGIVMKLTSIKLDEHLTEEGLWHMKVLDVHDEGQHETDEKDGNKLGELAVQSIGEAAEELNFNLALTGDYKVGENWASTH